MHQSPVMGERFPNEPLMSTFHRSQADIVEISLILVNEAVMRGTKDNEVVFDVMPVL